MLTQNSTGFDAHNKKIQNVADGVIETDAVNKKQLDAIQQGTVDLAKIEMSADGTAALPIFTRDGNTNTGIYFPAANNLGITTGGAERLNISSAGIDVTGAITVTTDQSFAKEANHSVKIIDSTTATVAGGNLSLTAGAGNTTGVGGNVTITAGNSGATAGTAGGNITLSPGTTTSTTVSSCIINTSNIVRKPLNTASVATGAVMSGKQLVDGYIAITGGTGNVQLPDTSTITTAIGATPAGTTLDFTVNAVGMTATNTVTFVVGANMTVPSAPAITGGGTLTLTQDTQVIGVFRLVYITSTTTKLFRIA